VVEPTAAWVLDQLVAIMPISPIAPANPPSTMSATPSERRVT
jgi:hypothetical protein